MASGHPKYGGTHGVPLLDLGQEGGARHTANLARLVVRVERGPMRVRTARHAMAQLTGVFEDFLGYDGQEITWHGTIVATNKATLDTIVTDLNYALAGHARDGNGRLLPFEVSAIRETQLTDFDGAILSDRTRITNWTPRGERRGQGKILTLDVTFIALV